MGFTPHQKTSRGWIFFVRLVDPSRNRLVSTAYFVIVSSVFCMPFFQSGQIYMKAFFKAYRGYIYIYILGLLDPIRNRLASTAYFAIVPSVFCMHGPCMIFWWAIKIKNKKISKVVKCTWKMWNRLNRKKNQISDFSDIYFSSYLSFLY